MANLQQDLYDQIGEPPDIPMYRFSAGQRDRDRVKLQAWDQMAQAVIPQVANPLRNSTLGQISNLSGYDPESLASPNQYKTREVDAPGPYTEAMQFTREGPRPMGTRMLPRYVDMPGPGAPVEQPTAEVASQLIRSGQAEPGSGIMRGYAERDPGMYREGPRPQAQIDFPQQVELQGPGKPLDPQMYARPTTITQTQRYVDPEAKATLEQQMLGMSGLKREGTWPRSMGAGAGQAWQQKYNTILEAYGKDAADYWAAENMLPDGAKRRNLNARTGSSEARQDNLKADTNNKEITGKNLQQTFDDKHKLNDRRISHMDFDEDYKDRLLQFRMNHADKMQRAIQNRDWAAIERLNETRNWHDRLAAMAGAIDKSGQGSDESREEFKRMFDTLSGMDERDATPEEMSLFEKWFGSGKRPVYTPRPPITGPNQSSSSVQPQSQMQPQAQTNPQATFSDAPPGSKVGQILRKDGKDIGKWDGKQWQPLNTK